MRGLYIEFEGVDGCGKTTLLDHVTQTLQRLDVPVLVTREPGSPHTKVNQTIREMLKWPEQDKPCPEAELYLFAADRAQHISRVVKPALKSGKVVLQDRGIWSTVAYQGFGRNQPFDLIWKMNKFTTTGLNPDAIIFVDTPLNITLKRIGVDRSDNADQISTFNKESFQMKVHDGYQHLAAFSKIPVWRLDGRKTVDELAGEASDMILQAIARTFLPDAQAVAG